MGKQLTPDWADWIQHNIARGCDKDGIFKILLDEGFSHDQITAEMNYEPAGFSRIVVLHSDKLHLPNAQRQATDLAEVYLLEDFLNHEECEKLVGLITSKLRTSEIARAAEDDSRFRTSSTCDLGVLTDPLVHEVDRRICSTLGVNASYSEVIQGQYYQPGQEFKAHTDYFEEDQFQQYAATQGQRTYTFMVYLNEVDEGGETEFSRLGIEIKPRLGRAVIWNNLTPGGTPNPDTIHHAHPVVRGSKCIITKWFRANGTGPMYAKE